MLTIRCRPTSLTGRGLSSNVGHDLSNAIASVLFAGFGSLRVLSGNQTQLTCRKVSANSASVKASSSFSDYRASNSQVPAVSWAPDSGGACLGKSAAQQVIQPDAHKWAPVNSNVMLLIYEKTSL
jgi:hypothetical protein